MAWTRPTSSSEFSLGRIWRNEGTTSGYYYSTCSGRPTLNSWKAVTSTYHLSVKFPTDYGIGQVQGDQLVVRECYLAMLAMNKHVQMMNIEERRVVAKPTKVLEHIPLEVGNPVKFTKI